jgi:hypothetical protein
MYQSQSIELDKIFVPPRVRNVDPKKVQDYMDSMLIHGLIHPIVTDKDLNLADGAHRLEAARALGWTHIDIRFKEAMPELERREIELVANLRRHDFSWQESAKGVLSLHDSYCAQDPSWTIAKTAERISFSDMWTWRLCEVARQMDSDTRVAQAESMSAAYNIINRKRERAMDKEMGLLEDNHAEPEVIVETPEGPTVEPLSETRIFDPPSIYQADFFEWVMAYKGPKFNFIHCDFPYGVGMDKSDQGRAQQWEGYKDDLPTYWKLVDGFITHLDRFCLPSAHIIFWFSMNYYEETKAKFEAAGLRVDPFPLIWHKSDNIGILPDATRGPRRIYETALAMSRGDRKILSPTSNLYSAPGKKIHHQSEKSESVLRFFFKMYIDEHSEVLDPTCGAGSALRAAEHFKAKRVLGLDISSENVQIATELLTNSRRLRALSGEH